MVFGCCFIWQNVRLSTTAKAHIVGVCDVKLLRRNRANDVLNREDNLHGVPSPSYVIVSKLC